MELGCKKLLWSEKQDRASVSTAKTTARGRSNRHVTHLISKGSEEINARSITSVTVLVETVASFVVGTSGAR